MVNVERALYPFQSRFYDRGGLKMHYIDEGAGEPVVMVHGNPSWSFLYRGMVQALSPRYRAIAPDHIGCGLSDKPGDARYEYTLKSRVDDLEALVDHLRLGDNLTLMLHDWGGMIGMAFACRHPGRVKRLVLLNTAAFLLPEGKKLPWSLKICRGSPLRAPLVRGFNAFARGAAAFGCRAMSPAVRRGFLAPYDSWANRIATLRFVEDIPLQPGDKAYELALGVDRSLHRFLGIPSLICWGEKDFVFDRHFLAEWARRFPGAQVHRFPEAGHYLLEDAGEEVASRVLSFLKSHSRAHA